MGKTIRFSGLILVCLILVFPVWLMISMSFTPSLGFLEMPPKLIPYSFTLENYRQIFRLAHLSRWIVNSFVVAITLVVGGIMINAAAAYVFRTCSARWLKYLFWLLMVPIFVTRIIIVIAQFMIVGKLAIPGLVAVVLFSLFWPVGIFLFRNFFASIPESLLESARIDGAGEWFVFLQIVLPLSKPILGVAIVFLGMHALGDYMWQMLNLQRAEIQTYLVGLVNSTIDVRVVQNIGYDLAVGTFLFIPYLILFAFSSRYFVKGLMVGGLKG